MNISYCKSHPPNASSQAELTDKVRSQSFGVSVIKATLFLNLLPAINLSLKSHNVFPSANANTHYGFYMLHSVVWV